MSNEESVELTGVHEYVEGYPVTLKRTTREECSGRLVIEAINQGGFDSVQIDLLELLSWIKRHRPELVEHERDFSDLPGKLGQAAGESISRDFEAANLAGEGASIDRIRQHLAKGGRIWCWLKRKYGYRQESYEVLALHGNFLDLGMNCPVHVESGLVDHFELVPTERSIDAAQLAEAAALLEAVLAPLRDMAIAYPNDPQYRVDIDRIKSWLARNKSS